VPLVIQVGKWRRTITLPNVEACKDNPIEDSNLTRLPKNRAEGDLPKVALVTGCDAMECLLRNVGIDDAEFTNPDGPGSVHVYRGEKGGRIDDATPEATSFWGDPEKLRAYDVVLLACECAVHPESKPEDARAAMRGYVNAGGRLFASHYHYFWLRDGGADLASTAQWQPDNDLLRGNVYAVDTSFPKGDALADWLVTVGASKKKGEIALGATPVDVLGVNPTTSQRWIHEAVDGGTSTKYLTFNTPVGSADGKECGRVVFTDLHVSGTGDGEVFPNGCTTKELSASEKALEFLLYDLSACVQDDSKVPNAPR
jgi:hypothetical protein